MWCPLSCNNLKRWRHEAEQNAAEQLPFTVLHHSTPWSPLRTRRLEQMARQRVNGLLCHTQHKHWLHTQCVSSELLLLLSTQAGDTQPCHNTAITVSNDNSSYFLQQVFSFFRSFSQSDKHQRRLCVSRTWQHVFHSHLCKKSEFVIFVKSKVTLKCHQVLEWKGGWVERETHLLFDGAQQLLTSLCLWNTTRTDTRDMFDWIVLAAKHSICQGKKKTFAIIRFFFYIYIYIVLLPPAMIVAMGAVSCIPVLSWARGAARAPTISRLHLPTRARFLKGQWP